MTNDKNYNLLINDIELMKKRKNNIYNIIKNIKKVMADNDFQFNFYKKEYEKLSDNIKEMKKIYDERLYKFTFTLDQRRLLEDAGLKFTHITTYGTFVFDDLIIGNTDYRIFPDQKFKVIKSNQT